MKPPLHLLRERAQLEQEWSELKRLQHQYRHTEQEVQQILNVASKGQIGEMDAIESVVRRILGVPKP